MTQGTYCSSICCLACSAVRNGLADRGGGLVSCCCSIVAAADCRCIESWGREAAWSWAEAVMPCKWYIFVLILFNVTLALGFFLASYVIKIMLWSFSSTNFYVHCPICCIKPDKRHHVFVGMKKEKGFFMIILLKGKTPCCAFAEFPHISINVWRLSCTLNWNCF